MTTPIYASPAGLPVCEDLDHIEAAVDQVVKAWSGVDADELWDWARIYDGEHGLSVHGQFAPTDDVTHALDDVATYSRRLDDIGLAEEDRPEVLRTLRLAQARARAFGADDTTIHARMAEI